MATLTPTVAGQHLHQKRQAMLDKFRSITFNGKSFYLDLSYNKRTQLLAKAICKMGGIIEGFLSKDVNYVVTSSRKASGVVNSQLTGGKAGQLQTAAKIKSPQCSRGKQLLKRAVQNQECNSLLTSAQSWGVCILHVDEVLDCLNNEGERIDIKKQTTKILKLKTPFLKIEDQSRKYRPLQCIFSNFPELSFISSDRSPFMNTNNSALKEQEPGEQEDDEVEKIKRPNIWEKNGYCECCQVPYTTLFEHMVSEQHSLFARDPSNYRVIDDITSHIICDLLEFPYESKSAEKCSTDVPCSADASQQSGAELCLKEEVKKTADPAKNVLVENDTSHSLECLPDEVTMETKETGSIEETKAVLQETGPLENNVGHGNTGSIGNAQPDDYDPTRQVTEVSWYMEETRLTSVYTVQSVVTPQVHLLAKHTELDTQGLLHSPQLLSTLLDPLSTLVTNAFAESHEPTQGESICDADTVPLRLNPAVQCDEFLVEEPVVVDGDLCNKLFAESHNGNVCTENLTTAHLTLENSGDGALSTISVTDSTVELHPELPLASVQNIPILSPDQLNLVSYNPASAVNDVVILSSESQSPFSDQGDQDPLLANTDVFKGKRKHCWSLCNPPAKRQAFPCQPVWVLHQFSSTGQWPIVPVFADSIGKNSNDLATEGTTALTTSCFNPMLAQYNVLSDSDWDSQLLSQQQSIPQQSAHYVDLRTTQVNLDKSRYAKKLYSVLAHDQSLVNPTTTQTVTLTHTSYDLYLHEVES